GGQGGQTGQSTPMTPTTQRPGGTTQPQNSGTPRPGTTPAAPMQSGGTNQNQQTVTRNASDLRQNDLGLSSNARGRRIASMFELDNSEVLIPAAGPQQPATRVPSPLNDTQKLKDSLPLLLDKLTTTRDQDLPARVNVNTAPQAVLKALPGLTESDVDT